MTKKQRNACYAIFFRKKNREKYEELYQFLLEHSSADPSDPAMLIEIIDPSNKKITSNTRVCCPRCGSTQISANQRGFSATNAIIGAAAIGTVGLAAGVIGSKKVTVTCLNCGYQWKAGKA